MTTKLDNAFTYAAPFANKADYRKELAKNGTLLGKSLYSRVDSVLALLYAASHGMVAKDKTSGAAAWADYAAARNKARPDAKPLAIDGKDARRDVSDFNLAVRLASISVPMDGALVNAGLHFLTFYARRPEYNAGDSGPMPVFKKGLRAAIKIAEDTKTLMNDPEFYAALAETKEPATDAERWQALASSIKSELEGSDTKRGRQDLDSRAVKACALLTELSQLLSLKGPAGKGKRKAQAMAQTTSGNSHTDHVLAESAAKAAESAAMVDAKADPDAVTKAVIAKGEAAAKSMAADTAKLKAAQAKADRKAAKAAKAKTAKADLALETSGTVSKADLAALAAKFNGQPNASDTVN
jgi:hypothetical protein